MALLTLQEYLQFRGGVAPSSTDQSSFAAIIPEAIDAVKRFLQNGNIEQTTYTIVMDAPVNPSLILPYAPVVADPAYFFLYVNWQANGDPAAFTSDFLNVMYRDYLLDVGPSDTTTCESGIVRLVANNIWGLNRERPPYSLSLKLTPLRGAIKVVYKAGYATVPPAIKAALSLIVSKIFNMRKLGIPLVSESLNGYSYSGQNAATADGIIQGDPTIRNLLKTFARPQVGSYY